MISESVGVIPYSVTGWGTVPKARSLGEETLVVVFMSGARHGLQLDWGKFGGF